MFTKEHAFDLAQRFIGIKEVGGNFDNPMIMSMLKLDSDWPEHDEVPWCAAAMNFWLWLCRLPRSKNLRALSFLTVGQGIHLDDAEPGDIVVLKRGKEPQPGPDVIEASGHVGFYAGRQGKYIEVLGGNQSDTVKVSLYPKSKLLSVRRIG